MKSIMITAMALVSLMAVTAIGGTKPDYKCQVQENKCVEGCDNQAGVSNARAYQDCLDRCSEIGKKCDKKTDEYRQVCRCIYTMH